MGIDLPELNCYIYSKFNNMKQNQTKNRSLLVYSILVLVTSLSLSSCSKSDDTKMQNPTPTPECDLSSVTFSNTVMPIISANCTSCHSGTSANAGIRLEDYASVKAQASIPAGSSGSLLGAIMHSAGNTPMPKDASKLSDCNISKINKWIQDGMPNN